MKLVNGKNELPTIGKGPALVERKEFIKGVDDHGIHSTLGIVEERADEIIEYAKALIGVIERRHTSMRIIIDNENLNVTEKIFCHHCLERIAEVMNNPMQMFQAMMESKED